jgi:hypothetical protein
VRITRLPVGATNKIDKKPLRALRWETTDRVWWRPNVGAPLRPITDDDLAAIRAEFEANGRRHVLG